MLAVVEAAAAAVVVVSVAVVVTAEIQHLFLRRLPEPFFDHVGVTNYVLEAVHKLRKIFLGPFNTQSICP